MATTLHVTSCQDEFRQQQIAVLWRASGATHTQVNPYPQPPPHITMYCIVFLFLPVFVFCRDIWCVGPWRLLVLTSLLHSTCSKKLSMSSIGSLLSVSYLSSSLWIHLSFPVSFSHLPCSALHLTDAHHYRRHSHLDLWTIKLQLRLS